MMKIMRFKAFSNFPKNQSYSTVLIMLFIIIFGGCTTQEEFKKLKNKFEVTQRDYLDVKEKYQKILIENNSLQNRLQKMGEEYKQCKSKLGEVETAEKLELMAKLNHYKELMTVKIEDYEKLLKEKELKAYYQAREELLNSIQVLGTPSSKKKFLWMKKHFFTFAVKIENQTRFEFTIETEDEVEEIKEMLSDMVKSPIILK